MNALPPRVVPRPTAQDDLPQLLRETYSALADTLDNIDATRWAEPSMCEGWTIAHVIAHLTMAARYDTEAITAELASDGFDFQAMSDRVAVRDASLPISTLIDNLRGEAMATFAMPDGGLEGSLSHVVIHGLDATWSLGLGRSAPDEATVVVLDHLVRESPNLFGIELDGLELRATDIDWASGHGRKVNRPAGELVLGLSGRRVDL